MSPRPSKVLRRLAASSLTVLLVAAAAACGVDPTPAAAPEQVNPAQDLVEGQRLAIWDDFDRYDSRDDLDGETAPSGHRYTTTNSGANTMEIINRRLVEREGDGTGPAVGTLYARDVDPLVTVAAEWVWLGGDGATTGSESVVVGSTRDGFDFGSIQLVMYAEALPTEPGVRWQVLSVPPLRAETASTVLASGVLNLGEFDRTGETKYRMSLRRSDRLELTVDLPDGNSVVVDAPAIRDYWGSTAGWQLNRPSGTDGFAAFTAIATAVADPASVESTSAD